MKKQKTKHNVLHYTLKYLIIRRKQEQLHNKLLLAINNCSSVKDLEAVLQFRSLHSEPLVMQVYRRRMQELEHKAAA